MPAILVVKPNDVVFAQIWAALDLDQLKRHLARVGKAVTRSRRDVSRLILLQDRDLVADRHLGAFRSAEDAFQAGYRPCQHCRPAGTTAAEVGVTGVGLTPGAAAWVSVRS